MAKLTLYSPVPTDWEIDPEVATQDHAALSIDRGTGIGLVSNGKLAGFSDALADRLRANGAGKVAQFARYYQEGPPDEALLGEVEQLVEAALVGLGN